ncbi:unnamed protein product [Boreogadus saida]
MPSDQEYRKPNNKLADWRDSCLHSSFAFYLFLFRCLIYFRAKMNRLLRIFLIVVLLALSFMLAVWLNNDHSYTHGHRYAELSIVAGMIPEEQKQSIISKFNGSSPLPPCPPTPPGLEGPLRIEFEWSRSMSDVRNSSRENLQEGGRYKPLDCIAQHKVAVIIPYRNRKDHLKHWLYYLHPILKRQQVDYGVYVINQHGEGTFNRAKLLNVGYVESLKEYAYDCFVFSDVDLVPMDDRNLYRCHGEPRHMAVAMDKFGFQMPYKNYFGGVVALSRVQYMRINGFPNNYWGWGAEDDDMHKRITLKGMAVSRPDSRLGMYKMVRHLRDTHNEVNPQNPGQLHNTAKTMNSDGINSLIYSLIKIEKDELYTMIDVDIHAPN